MKKTVAVIITWLLIISLAACQPVGRETSAPDSVPTPSSQSPELPATASPAPTEEATEGAADNSSGDDADALLIAFVGHAANRNGDAMIASFAVDEYIGGYDEKLMAEYLGVEPDYPGVQPPTLTQRMEEVASGISLFYIGFVMEGLDLSTATQDDVNMALGALDCSELNVLRVDQLDLTAEAQEIIAAQEKKRAAQYGAEDLCRRAMLLELNGQTYYCGATLVRYGGAWKLYELSIGGLLPVDPYVVTYPMTASDYEKLLTP